MRIAQSPDSPLPESLVDGPGLRLVLFLAGCRHACPGCHNAWLQDFQAGQEAAIEAICQRIVSQYQPGWHDGLTISGGDPLEQPAELARLLRLLKEKIPALNLWLYTGYLYEEIQHLEALNYLDALVDGPFLQQRVNEGQLFRGSGNQRIFYLRRGIPIHQNENRE